MTQALRATPIAAVALHAAALATAMMTAVLSSSELYAQDDARSQLLVSAEWLAQHLDDPNLVLLHVGDRDDYDEALSLHLQDVSPLQIRKRVV